MKYVVFSSYKGEEIIIFPKIIQHSVMADDVKRSSFGGMNPISGGFIVDGKCVGRSESLRMNSRGELDEALIPKLLDLDVDDDYIETRFPDSIVINDNNPSKNKAKRLRKKARK